MSQYDEFINTISKADLWDDRTYGILRSFHTTSALENFLRAVPDDLIPKILHASYGYGREEDFDVVFNHIVEHRSHEVWKRLIANDRIISPTYGRFQHPGIWKSALKFMEVVLPTMVAEFQKFQIYKLNYALAEFFKALYKMPNRKELFHKFGEQLRELLTNAGLEPNEVFQEAFKYNDKILSILMNSVSPSWKKIRAKVLGTTAVHIWDTICYKGAWQLSDEEKTFLREKARFHNIPNAESLNPRQLCAELAKVELQIHDCALDDTDPWTMESMNEIPAYKRYKVGNQCFNIESLVGAIQRGETRNPFDRSELPVSDISSRYNTITNTFNQKQKVASYLENIPMLSKEQERAQALANIWSNLTYPIPVVAFVTASAEDLDKVVDALQSYSVVPISRNEVQMYRGKSNRDEKFNVLVQILQRLISLPQNELTSTIKQAIELGINENITVPQAVRRRRSSADDDEEEMPSSQRRRTSGGKRKRRRSSKKYRKKSFTQRRRTSSKKKKSSKRRRF